MDSLYLLVPLSVLLVLGLIALFGWAINAGQFEDLEREGWRALQDPTEPEPVAPAPPASQIEGTSTSLDVAQPGSNRPF